MREGCPLPALLVLAGCASTGSGDARKVTIKRDTYGVPHVYANDTRGLFHGYGYVVAEDRLYQMEMARRAVLGTVAEVLGLSLPGIRTALIAAEGPARDRPPPAPRARRRRQTADWHPPAGPGIVGPPG